jgi:hypothetical protein
MEFYLYNEDVHSLFDIFHSLAHILEGVHILSPLLLYRWIDFHDKSFNPILYFGGFPYQSMDMWGAGVFICELWAHSFF